MIRDGFTVAHWADFLHTGALGSHGLGPYDETFFAGPLMVARICHHKEGSLSGIRNDEIKKDDTNYIKSKHLKKSLKKVTYSVVQSSCPV